VRIFSRTENDWIVQIAALLGLGLYTEISGAIIPRPSSNYLSSTPDFQKIVRGELCTHVKIITENYAEIKLVLLLYVGPYRD
jgi:hypothetical protein